MDQNSARLLRLRGAGLDALAVPRRARGTPQFLCQIVSGGAMSAAADRVFLAHPVRLDGDEREGATATIVADGSRTVPVVVMGSAPRVGDLVVAVAAGGRWVARKAGTPAVGCSPCALPQKDLALSWTNLLIGNGSTRLRFTPPSWWMSGCVNQMQFVLTCYSSAIQLSATYYLGGGCPDGQGQSCASPGASPFAFNLARFTCSPLYLQYTVTDADCPALAGDGYTSLTITE